MKMDSNILFIIIDSLREDKFSGRGTSIIPNIYGKDFGKSSETINKFRTRNDENTKKIEQVLKKLGCI